MVSINEERPTTSEDCSPVHPIPAAPAGWPSPDQLADPESCWWVLRTRSRQEKAIAGELLGRQIPFFLPLVSASRYHGRRRQQVDLPLFPGYIFLHGDREATFVADRTRRIAGILDVDRHQQPELHQELDNLRKAIQLEAGFDPYPYLRHGHWAEVKSGPYKGLRGRIDREAAPGKLILQVDLLQSAMALELDGAELEPLSDPSRQEVGSRK